MGEAAQQFDQADLHFRHPPDLPNIEVAQPKPANEVYAEKVIAIQKKLALLPAKETANLTPLISRIREQGKIDLQRAIGYADVLLGALEAEPPSGRKNPIELPVQAQILQSLLANQIFNPS